MIKKAEHPEVGEAVYTTWFIQQRNHNITISSEILRAKAKFLYCIMTGKDDFWASAGWLEMFNKQHEIRFLKICGEKISSDINAVSIKVYRHRCWNEFDWRASLQCRWISAFWRVLTGTTWVHANSKVAPGRKFSKERVKFMPCSNAVGTHKLPLLVIGKSVKPRAFENAILLRYLWNIIEKLTISFL